MGWSRCEALPAQKGTAFMQNQNTQQPSQGQLHLAPTKLPSVFTIELRLGFETRYIGKLDRAGEGTFMCKRTEKHLHRKTGSLGINQELVRRFDFRWIVIEYAGRRLVTTKLYLLHHGRVFTFGKAGFESQIFLSLDDFGERKALEFETTLVQQGELFAEAA
jgi:hypothetical protein